MEDVKTIGKDYSLFQLAKFALPAVLNEFIITLLYTIDDGLFISRYVGQNALAAFSIISPLFMLHNAIASLLGGVSSLVSYKMGEGKNKEARSDFSTMILFVFVVGVFVGLIERIFLRQIVNLLGATDIIYPYAADFMKIGALYTPLVLVGGVFMRFYVPAGKPQMELFTSVLNVSCNLFFDWYFVVYKGVGMIGAAYANLIATIVMVIVALLFFSNKKCEVAFTKPESKILPLLKGSFKYGISYFLSNASVAVSVLVSNYALLHWGSEEYLAAFTIVNNIQFVFMNSYFGLTGTTSPIVSYAMGEKNKEKLNKTFKQLFILLTSLSIFTVILFLLFGEVIADLFISESARKSKDIIMFGMKIAPYSFLFFGYNVATRITFSSLGNHRASVALALIHEIVLSNLTIILLPMLFTIKGVWFSFLTTNILMLFITIFVIYINRDNYGYGKSKIAYLID